MQCSVTNHITALGSELDGIITDSGEHANRFLSPDEVYNNMLYDITKGLFLNDWSDKIKEVLGL